MMRLHEYLSSTGSADAPGSADEDDTHLGQGAGRRRVLRQGKCTPTTRWQLRPPSSMAVRSSDLLCTLPLTQAKGKGT